MQKEITEQNCWAKKKKKQWALPNATQLRGKVYYLLKAP